MDYASTTEVVIDAVVLTSILWMISFHGLDSKKIRNDTATLVSPTCPLSLPSCKSDRSI